METLPTELRQAVLRYLDLKALKAMRLTSTSWASLGEEYLILPTIHCNLHRNDFSRLHDLSQHPTFSAQIREIKFDFGELNEYHARHNLFYINYMRENSSEISVAGWEAYKKLRGSRDNYTEDYCYPMLLGSSLPRLPNLSVIDISLARSPFIDHLLHHMFDITTSQLFPRDATVRRFTSILNAAETSTVKEIRHDRLPLEFWAQDSSLVNTFNGTFSKLETLHLRLHRDSRASANRHNAAFAGLGGGLCAAQQLRTLHLGFAHAEPVRISFEKLLGGVRMGKLHTLAIKGISVSEEDFARFLIGHAATLRRLRLVANAVIDSKTSSRAFFVHMGTLKGLLTRLRGKLKLEKLHLQGCILVNDADEMVSDFKEGWYDDQWEESGVSAAGIAKGFETYLAGEGEWPNSRETVDGDLDAYVTEFNANGHLVPGPYGYLFPAATE